MMGLFDKSPLFGPPAPGFPETDPLKFDDADACAEMNLAFPTRIDFHQGHIVDGLEIHYGSRSLKHGGQGGSPNKFTLEAGEHIVRMEGKYSPWGSGTIMDLVFFTDKGRGFGKGRPTAADEGYFSCDAPKGHAIFALYGRADHYIRHIGFYTRPIKMEQGGSIFPGGLGSLKFGEK